MQVGLLPPGHCGVEIGRKAREKSREREGKERRKGKAGKSAKKEIAFLLSS